MPKGKVLLVDDEEKIRETLSLILKAEGYETDTAKNGLEALDKLNANQYNVILTDIKMPKMNGLELLKEIRNRKIKVIVVFLTAYTDVEDAVDVIKLGAFDYIEKDFTTDELLEVVKGAVKAYENEKLTEDESKRLLNENFMETIVANSKSIKLILDKIAKIADSNTPVLIIGENGTGKEFFARIIHSYSERNKKPFVSVNCGAMGEKDLEAELFGYESGAFIGALIQKKAKLEIANGGTVFLDNVDSLSPMLQSELFKFLSDKEFERVGGLDPVRVDIRVIAACEENIKEKIKNGLFRKDLYKRLNILSIFIPPLRERKEDIPLLADYFLRKYNNEYDKNILGISKQGLNMLEKYSWPENTRELKTVVERAVALADKDKTKIIKPEDFPPYF